MEELKNRKVWEVRAKDADGKVKKTWFTTDNSFKALFDTYTGDFKEYLKACGDCSDVEVVEHEQYKLHDLAKTSAGLEFRKKVVIAQTADLEAEIRAKKAEEAAANK